MREYALRLPFALLFICNLWSHYPDSAQRAPSPTPPPACRMDKISFTQDIGCFNDGSFEFCLPADDTDALTAAQRIAPNIVCMRAGGRARCDLDTEILCLVSTDGMCQELQQPMTDSGWQTVCELAALPFVRQIVPTWYE